MMVFLFQNAFFDIMQIGIKTGLQQVDEIGPNIL